MKKLFLLATVVVAMTFASCGNKTQPSANAEADSTEMSTDSTKVVAADIPEDVKALTSQLAEKLGANDASGIAATIEGAKAKAVEMAKNNPEKRKRIFDKTSGMAQIKRRRIKESCCQCRQFNNLKRTQQRSDGCICSKS